MELAVQYGEQYRFTAEYYGASLGYMIKRFNNNANKTCFWFFYTLAPDETDCVKSSIGVSSFIPCDGFTIILRYEKLSGLPLNVHYQIEHSPECSQRPNQTLITVHGLASGSSALDVMEGAVTASLSPKPYEFVATNCAPATGYFIDAIGSTVNDDYPVSLCYWTFFIKYDGVTTKQDISVSKYIIPGDGYTVIMKYTKASQQQSCDTLPPVNKKVQGLCTLWGLW